MANKDFTIGFDESQLIAILNSLQGMEGVDKIDAIMNSLSKGVGLVIRQGKSNLSSRNKSKKGNLKKSFGKKRVKKWVSVYGGFRRSGGYKGNHAHLVDRGTAERWTKKGYYRGSVSKGRPNTGSRFWTDAINSKADAAMEKTMNVVKTEMEKITSRNKRK